MNRTIEERLAELSDLWESGEWRLHSSHHSCSLLTFVFPAGRPSLRELLGVRALVPRFTVAPMSLLKAEVGNVPEFEVGVFGNLEARSLEAKARAHGLEVRSEDKSGTCYFPLNVNGHGMLIEDAELASLAIEEMRRRGVPVVAHAEYD